jgi:uncharacterized protein (DUF1330 family)
MPAYLVYLCRDVRERQDLEKYWEEVQATFEGQHMKLRVAYTPFEVLESDGEDLLGVVVAEFPSYEACKAWYDSPGYVAARQHRIRGASYLGMLVDGGITPPAERMPHTKPGQPA